MWCYFIRIFQGKEKGKTCTNVRMDKHLGGGCRRGGVPEVLVSKSDQMWCHDLGVAAIGVIIQNH